METNTVNKSTQSGGIKNPLIGDCLSTRIAACVLMIWTATPTPVTGKPAQQGSAPKVLFATQGRASMDVVVAAGASERVREHARTLSDYLSRITGAQFHVTTGDGQTGIAVGLATDFPALGAEQYMTPPSPFDGDRYLLRTHTHGLHVIGKTPIAVSHGVWDLLYELGYRHYMIGDAWEIIPTHRELSYAVDRREIPDYRIRQITRGARWVHWPLTPQTRDWLVHNRLLSPNHLVLKHIYQSIIHDNQAAFDTNPQYLALHDGQRQGNKFCISNKDLRQLVTDWAINYFARNSQANHLSLEPSDGGGWCQCDRCKAMGSVTDQVLALTNQVTQAVSNRFGPRHIILLAYNQHGAPPTLRVHPNILVHVATSWLYGYKPDDLLHAWSSQGAKTLGIYEYPDEFNRTHNLPARARIASPDYLKNTLGTWHQRGAMFYYGDAAYSIGANGLGLYLASQILWDTEKVDHVDVLVDDFLNNAFTDEKTPMRRFFEVLETTPTHAARDVADYQFEHDAIAENNRMGVMFKALRDAFSLTSTNAVRNRLNQLLLYTRYVELSTEVLRNEGAPCPKAVNQLTEFVYRIRKLPVISAYWYLREAASANDPAPRIDVRSILMGDEPFTQQELGAMLEAGVRRWSN